MNQSEWDRIVALEWELGALRVENAKLKRHNRQLKLKVKYAEEYTESQQRIADGYREQAMEIFERGRRQLEPSTN